MTDPFLISGYDDKPARAYPARKTAELARKSGLPQAFIDLVPPEAIQRFVTRVERWADLTADLRQALEEAGFQQHHPSSAGGGFHLAAHAHDDGVLVCWTTRKYSSHEPGSFENVIPDIMRPTLEAILAVCGFATQTIPEGQDNAGYVLVTGRSGSPA